MTSAAGTAQATPALALDSAAVRELALDYNRAYLARASRFEDFDASAVERDILAGDVVILCGQASTHGGATVVYASVVVTMPTDSPLGEFAHIADVVEATVRLPKGMPTYKAGEWWARKHFGASLPLHVISEAR